MTSIQKFEHDDQDAADLVDVDHRIVPVGLRIGDNGHDMLREVVEFFWRHDLSQKSTYPAARAISGACRTTLVEPPIAMATITALRIESLHNVAWPEAFGHHVFQVADQFGRERIGAAFVVGGGGDHVQGLHANDTDECLHSVVGEHAAAAANPRTGMEGDIELMVWIRVSGNHDRH